MEHSSRPKKVIHILYIYEYELGATLVECETMKNQLNSAKSATENRHISHEHTHTIRITYD